MGEFYSVSLSAGGRVLLLQVLVSVRGGWGDCIPVLQSASSFVAGRGRVVVICGGLGGNFIPCLAGIGKEEYDDVDFPPRG